LLIRIAVSSGHGTGKGAFLAWVIDWIMSTRPGSRGSVMDRESANKMQIGGKGN